MMNIKKIIKEEINDFDWTGEVGTSHSDFYNYSDYKRVVGVEDVNPGDFISKRGGSIVFEVISVHSGDGQGVVPYVMGRQIESNKKIKIPLRKVLGYSPKSKSYITRDTGVYKFIPIGDDEY